MSASYHALFAYPLAHAREDPSFLHQHVVDAWAAQQATAGARPMGIAFAPIGLLLHVKRGYAGREVQQVHVRLARGKRGCPAFPLPHRRGGITSVDVLAAPPISHA